MAASGGNHEPNLTPLIDLFSVLIVFLLMTASWLQLTSLQVQVEQKPPSDNATKRDTENLQDKNDENEKKVQLGLKLFRDKIISNENGSERVFSVFDLESSSSGLAFVLSSWKQKYPNKNTLVISTDASATYGQLIKVYDFAVASGWPEIGINPY